MAEQRDSGKVEYGNGKNGSGKEKLLVTSTEGTSEVESEVARDGDEERVITVEEVIVLDEGTRGVGEEGG